MIFRNIFTVQGHFLGLYELVRLSNGYYKWKYTVESVYKKPDNRYSNLKKDYSASLYIPFSEEDLDNIQWK